MKIRFSVFAALLLSISHAQAQPAGAKNAFARFLKLNRAHQLKRPTAQKLLMEEARNYAKYGSVGRLSPPNSFQTMPLGAVARVGVLNERNVVVSDAYFYLKREKGAWKVSAARSFALTGIIFMARDELKKKARLSAQERDELANMNLLLASDATLKAYFLKNRADFEKLRLETARSGVGKKALERKLALDSVIVGEKGAVDFIIGGVTDNTVGFGYSPRDKLPPIDPGEKIWVERLAPRWFLFRTT